MSLLIRFISTAAFLAAIPTMLIAGASGGAGGGAMQPGLAGANTKNQFGADEGMGGAGGTVNEGNDEVYYREGAGAGDPVDADARGDTNNDGQAGDPGEANDPNKATDGAGGGGGAGGRSAHAVGYGDAHVEAWGSDGAKGGPGGDGANSGPTSNVGNGGNGGGGGDGGLATAQSGLAGIAAAHGGNGGDGGDGGKGGDNAWGAGGNGGDGGPGGMQGGAIAEGPAGDRKITTPGIPGQWGYKGAPGAGTPFGEPGQLGRDRE